MPNYDYGQVVSGIASSLSSALNLAAPGLGALTQPLAGIGNAMSSQYKEQQTIDSEQRANAEYDRRFAMANTEYDRRQAEMNAYNSPEAQAQRLKAAGINPISALAGNAPVASANPSLSQPSVSASATPPSANNSYESMTPEQAVNVRKEPLERKLLEIQNDIAKEQKEGLISDNFAKELENDFKEATQTDRIEQFKILVQKDEYEKEIAKNNAAITGEQAKTIEFATFLSFASQLQDLEIGYAGLLESYARIKNIMADTESKMVYTRSILKEMEKMDHDMFMDRAELSWRMIEHYSSISANKELQEIVNQHNKDMQDAKLAHESKENKRNRWMSVFSTIIGVGGTVAGVLLAPVTGGASLAAIPLSISATTDGISGITYSYK